MTELATNQPRKITSLSNDDSSVQDGGERGEILVEAEYLSKSLLKSRRQCANRREGARDQPKFQFYSELGKWLLKFSKQ